MDASDLSPEELDHLDKLKHHDDAFYNQTSSEPAPAPEAESTLTREEKLVYELMESYKERIRDLQVSVAIERQRADHYEEILHRKFGLMLETSPRVTARDAADRLIPARRNFRQIKLGLEQKFRAQAAEIRKGPAVPENDRSTVGSAGTVTE